MSEVDLWGRVLTTFTDVSLPIHCEVSLPIHLSLDTEDRVLVADCWNHRILLLSSEIQLQRVLIDTSSKVKPWKPKQRSYNDLRSQLYVVHGSSTDRRLPWSDVVTAINLR